MRLLFVNYEFPPLGGGAAYASLALARELVALGHGVDFLTTVMADTETDTAAEGIRVHHVPSLRRGIHQAGMFGALSFVGLAAARIGQLARRTRYDACHYYFGIPTGLLSLVPGAHRQLPYIVSLRGSDVPGYDPALNVPHRLLRPLSRRIWQGAWRIIANSADLRRQALQTLPQARIDVILNGAAALSALPVRNDGHRGLRILTVGRLIARKGMDTVIRALQWTDAEQLSLDIAGEGPDESALRRLAAHCGVADRVRFHGFVDRAGLAALRARSDMFVLASHAESCSMALLEAMGAGLPLLASGVGGTLELVLDGHSGLLFDSGNAEQLAAAMRALAANPGLRQRIGTANLALVREQCSWRSVARRYEQLFQAAAGIGELSSDAGELGSQVCDREAG